ncbi:MAG: hypothetical protein Q9170_000169 [Blastenia crenularia]
MARSESTSALKEPTIQPELSPQKDSAAEIVERPVQPSSLPTLRWQEICWDFYHGHCRLEDACPRDHSICQVQGMANAAGEAPHLSMKPNVLSLEPRSALAGGPFDDDGPSHPAWLGPRHNNDYAEVRQSGSQTPYNRAESFQDSLYTHPTNNRRDPLS